MGIKRKSEERRQQTPTQITNPTPTTTTTTISREQVEAKRKEVNISSFLENEGKWVFFYCRQDGNDKEQWYAGYHDSTQGFEEKPYPHQIEAANAFNTMRASWLEANGIR